MLFALAIVIIAIIVGVILVAVRFTPTTNIDTIIPKEENPYLNIWAPISVKQETPEIKLEDLKSMQYLWARLRWDVDHDSNNDDSSNTYEVI